MGFGYKWMEFWVKKSTQAIVSKPVYQCVFLLSKRYNFTILTR